MVEFVATIITDMIGRCTAGHPGITPDRLAVFTTHDLLEYCNRLVHQPPGPFDIWTLVDDTHTTHADTTGLHARCLAKWIMTVGLQMIHSLDPDTAMLLMPSDLAIYLAGLADDDPPIECNHEPLEPITPDKRLFKIV